MIPIIASHLDETPGLVTTECIEPDDDVRIDKCSYEVIFNHGMKTPAIYHLVWL